MYCLSLAGPSAGSLKRTRSSGVGGARLEGWPPLFPDASVRGEEGNIDSDTDFWHERNRRA